MDYHLVLTNYKNNIVKIHNIWSDYNFLLCVNAQF